MSSSSSLPVPSGIHFFVDLVHNSLNLDILVIANIWILVTGAITSIRLAGDLLHNFAEKTCLSTVNVKQEDPLYEAIVLWMDDHVFKRRNFRSVLAHTTKSSDDAALARSLPEILDADKLISYQEIGDNSSVELKPFHGSRLFRFKRKWLLFSHATNNHENISRYSQIEVKPQLKLQCLSLSLSPIKDFLDEVRAYKRKVSVSKITVFRTRSGSRDITRWTSVASRPSRDITTVILDKHKKKAILRDINEYLHPHTRQWYANHGIPYRRGYLFSGPPGTGKTSLASALAGVFGLDIYVLSLLDQTVTEPHFIRLFGEVPTRCVVLLEDIDAAGLNRGNIVPGDALTKSRSAAAQTSSEDKAPAANTTAISLSGLLNAIDGISSQEGRILIMTTNAPQSLDRALIRPGRVDLHIQFELPSHEELRSLFLNMYSDIPQNLAADAEDAKLQPASLNDLAMRFAELLPEKRFSLAEVQGFLLKYKRRPEEACENVSRWVKEMEEGDSSS
ncbi:hypothetical protein N7461_005377 [Penicillium sp. DV-2018c]|nr:hypothetical protein N7461_005377 [Penicillium sp. DV-2018c]